MTANKGKMNCALHMTSNFQYWFGSIVNFGCLIGALAGGSLADKFGKKKIMVYGNFDIILTCSVLCCDCAVTVR